MTSATTARRSATGPGAGAKTGAAARVGVFTDYVYHRDGDRVYAERAFALFLAEVARQLGSMTLIGRVDPSGPGVKGARYPLPAGVGLVELPWYKSLAGPAALAGTARSLGRFWRSLRGLDVVWLLGPHPLAIAFVMLARVRRVRVVLGVRQNLPAYVANRRPGSRVLRLAALVLDRVWRRLARRRPVVVVGPDLARRYGASRDLLEIWVSLVRTSEIADPGEAIERPTADSRTVLSVGRLDPEKNPLLLAEVLAGLEGGTERRWRLRVCGEGPMAGALDRRLDGLGVREGAELCGYVEQGEPLRSCYRESDAFLHVSWSEGLPQVLVEAFAAGLPVVATDVGGVREAVGGAALVIPPGDADAAVAGLRLLMADRRLRADLIRAGNRLAREHTLEREAGRVAALLRA